MKKKKGRKEFVTVKRLERGNRKTEGQSEVGKARMTSVLSNRGTTVTKIN